MITADTAEAGIASGEQGGERAGLVEIGELEVDVVIDHSLVHQSLESSVAKCVVEVFNVVASQLVDSDANHQLGCMLLRLKVSDRKDGYERRQ